MALLILTTLVVGYWNCRGSLSTRYKIYRYSTQQLYLRVAEYGLCCLILSFTLIYFYSRDVFDYIWLHLLVGFTAEEYGQENIANVLVVFAISTVLSAFFIRLLVYGWNVIKLILDSYKNKSGHESEGSSEKDVSKGVMWEAIFSIVKDFLELNKDSEYLNALAVLDSMKGEPINEVIYRAAIYKSVIKLDMENGKSYIGAIENVGEATETGGVDHSLSVAVIDIVDTNETTYEEEMNQLKVFQTEYYKKYSTKKSDGSESGGKAPLPVSLRQHNILSVTLISP